MATGWHGKLGVKTIRLLSTFCLHKKSDQIDLAAPYLKLAGFETEGKVKCIGQGKQDCEALS